MTEHENDDNQILEDASTSAGLRAAFEVVSFDRPLEEITAAAPAAVAPRRSRRPLVLAGSVAAAVAAITAAVVILPGGSSAAWAATPSPVSSSDELLATKACAVSLPGLAGRPTTTTGGDQGGTVVSSSGDSSGGTHVEGSGPAPGSTSVVAGSSGTVTVTGGGTSAPVDTAIAPAGLPAPPTTLPPLVAVDRRADRALAVFEGGGTSVACLLSIDGGTWNAGGLMVGILAKGTGQPAAQMGIVTAEAGSSTGGKSDNVVAGTVGSDVAKVTLTFSDGTVAEATVTHGIYAAWFPGDFGTAPPTITMYDAAGHTI